MIRMLWALAAFAVGILILSVIVWLCHLVIGMLALPAPIDQIALIVIGLVGLIVLIIMCINIYNGTLPPRSQ